MPSEFFQALIAVLISVSFFLLIIVIGMGRTILKVRREARFNAKDRRHLIDSVRYTTRGLCAREAAYLLRDYLTNFEDKLPELYVKKEDDKYEKYELYLIRNHMKSIRELLQKKMVWEMSETGEYDELQISSQAPRTQQT